MASIRLGIWAVHHRGRRRHQRRPALGDPPLLGRRQDDDDRHRGARRRSPSSCWASSSSTSSRSYPNRTRTGPSGPSCARPAIGPDTWTLFFIPTGEQWRYLILPAITLASVSTALAARMTRGSMLEVMRADYMRTARAKGLPRARRRRRATASAMPCFRSSRSSASTSAP